MPKPSTMPFIIDEAKEISISNLRKWNYLEPNKQKEGSLKWSRNGIETSSCSITILMNESRGFLRLNYICNENKYIYEVQIISKASNLGKGNVLYFICPFTKKVCRKLHLYNERFIHRSAIIGGMYSKQIESKKYRQIARICGSYFKSEKYFEILYSKNFKRSYNGKPTKRYLKLMEKINDSNRFNANDIKKPG